MFGYGVGFHGQQAWLTILMAFAVTVASSEESTEQLQLADTDCNAVGERIVNVLWKPGATFKSTTQYSVYFCKDPATRISTSATPEEDYIFGCSDIAHQEGSSETKRHYRQCNLGERLHLSFPSESFSYYIKANNSNGIYWSRKNECRLSMKFRCTKPQNVMVESVEIGQLILHWSYPPFMGDNTHILCYRIFYAAEGDLKNMTRGPLCQIGHRSAAFHKLKPYTGYKFYVQCTIDNNIPEAWGDLAGPSKGITQEEVPSQAPEFRISNPIETIYGEHRNVTVSWKSPPKHTWNGIIERFIIIFWKVALEPSNETLPSKQVIIRDEKATSGVIFGLDRFSDYKCRIMMCTKAGCGPKSETKRILGIEDGRSRPDVFRKPTGRTLSFWLIVISILVVAAIIAALILVICIKLRRQRQQPALPQNLTVSSHSLRNESDENPEVYDCVDTSNYTIDTSLEPEPLTADEQVSFLPGRDMPAKRYAGDRDTVNTHV